MERKNKCKNVGFFIILWAVMAILLSAVPCIAVYPNLVASDPPYTLTEEAEENIFVIGGTLLLDRGYSDWIVVSYGALEIYRSHGWDISDSYISISDSATLTVKLFADSITSIDFLHTEFGSPYLEGETIKVGSEWKGTLQWSYQGTTYFLNIDTRSDITVEVVGSPTPEQLIQDLIDYVNTLNLDQGIDNSLDAKLQNARDALEAANAGQRQDAVNKMNAFISAVEAQSGKAIPSEDADDLIDLAVDIILLL